ncbi:hypothetical protein D3C78_1621280 [compost metagenome]
MLGIDLEAVATLAVTQRAGLLEDAPAGTLDGLRQPVGQLQRIQVRRVWIVETGLVALAGDPLRQLVTRNEAQPLVAPAAIGLGLPVIEHADPARQHRRPQVTDSVVAVEAMPLRQFA